MSVSYAAEMNIDLGEKIYVRCIVKPKCEQELPFVIRNARWGLKDTGGVLEDEGECIINGHEISAFIAPQKAGTYRLKYTYEIADETWVDNVKLKVG